MQKLPTPARPVYSVTSVDNALRLIHMLRDRGEVRLKTAAVELAVAESTVHRLMAMLVFHGFAQKDARRAYIPGPALGAPPVQVPGSDKLRHAASPHMAALAQEVGETVNLMVRVGTRVRFIWSCEGEKLLRIVSRLGAVLPAAKAAGGRVLLAALPEDNITKLYQGPAAEARGDAMDDASLQQLVGRLGLVRLQGHAAASDETELGVAAIAAPVRDAQQRVVAALGISVPSARFSDLRQDEMLARLLATRDAIESDLPSGDLDDKA